MPSSTPPPSGPGRPFYTRWWFIAAIVVAILALVGGAVALLNGDDDESGSEATEATEATEPTDGAPGPTDSVPETTQSPETTEASTTTAPTPTTRGPATTAVSAGGDGSRESPLALGQSIALSTDWEVAVVAFDGDATAAVLAENQFNEPPPEGSAYVLITVRATYAGAEPSSPYFDLSVGVAGPDDVKYQDTDCSAVVPNDMVDQPELAAGETAEGAFCAIVPVDLVPSVDAYVEPTFSVGDEIIWWRTS